MNVFSDAVAWIFSPDRLTAALPLPAAIWPVLAFTLVAVRVAAARATARRLQTIDSQEGTS